MNETINSIKRVFRWDNSKNIVLVFVVFLSLVLNNSYLFFGLLTLIFIFIYVFQLYDSLSDYISIRNLPRILLSIFIILGSFFISMILSFTLNIYLGYIIVLVLFGILIIVSFMDFKVNRYNTIIKFSSTLLKIEYKREDNKLLFFLKSILYLFYVRTFEDIRVNKIDALINLKKYDEALRVCDKILENDNKNIDIWLWKANILFLISNKYEEAIKCYDEAIATGIKNNKLWEYKGDYLKALGRYKEAIECYNESIKINPKAIKSMINKAKTLFLICKYQDALILLDNVIEINPKNVLAYISKGICLVALERHDEALLFYDKAIKKHKKEKDIFKYLKANVFISLRKYQEAINFDDEAIAINPKWRGPYINKIQSLIMLQEYEDALKNCDKVIEIAPNEIDGYIHKGKILTYQGKYQEALVCYDKLIEIAPQYLFTYLNKIDIYKLQERDDLVQDCYKKIIEICNEILNANLFSYTLLLKGYALSHLGKDIEALKYYKKAVKINNDIMWMAYRYTGKLLSNINDYEGAIKCYNKAIEHFPKEYQIILEKIQCLIKFKKIKEAKDLINEMKLFDTLPNFDQMDYFFILNLFLKLGDYQSIDRIYTEIPSSQLIKETYIKIQGARNSTNEERIKLIKELENKYDLSIDKIMPINKLFLILPDNYKDIQEMKDKLYELGSELTNHAIESQIGHGITHKKLDSISKILTSMNTNISIIKHTNKAVLAGIHDLDQKMDKLSEISEEIYQEAKKTSDKLIEENPKKFNEKKKELLDRFKIDYKEYKEN